jgi:AcrR family transcriptional regulator
MPFTERSEPARTAILAAARRRFTDDGYERTTVRSVAADAGVDPSMVMRYFQSKDGLFNAATAIDLHFPELGGTPIDEVPALLARHFVNRWEGDLADEAIMVLLRSAVTNPAAAERLRTVFATQVTTLVRTLTHGAADSATRAGLISTQLLGIALCRYILRLPPVAALSPAALIEAVTPVLRHFLTEPLSPVSPHSMMVGD